MQRDIIIAQKNRLQAAIIGTIMRTAKSKNGKIKFREMKL